MSPKRLRIFAGPNGSGKTILKKELEEGKYFSLYEYFNPDDILRDIQDRGFYELFYFEKFDKIIEFAINSSYRDNVKKFFKKPCFQANKNLN